MPVREHVIRRYAEWTVLSALRRGPIRSRATVYPAIQSVDFQQVTTAALGDIPELEFDEWHARATLRLGEIQPLLNGQVGWAAKAINVYLKTYAYVGDQGRPNLRMCLHPPIDQGLWTGIARRFPDRQDILNDTHHVTRINAINSIDSYRRLLRGLRAASAALDCALIEVEQLWQEAAHANDN